MDYLLGYIFAPISAHRRTLLAMNLLYWGAMVAGIAATAVDRSLQPALTQKIVESLSPTGSLGQLVQAYTEGQLLNAILLTFGVNLILGSLLEITVLSAALPFAGLLTGIIRAALWGILFSPFGGIPDIAFLLRVSPHALTVLIEGEAYVVAMLGVWLWWQPVFGGAGKRWLAWQSGLALQVRIYLAVALILAVAAAWEAFEVIYIVSR